MANRVDGEGRVTLQLELDRRGAVVHTTASASTLPPSVVSCVRRVLGGLSFEPPTRVWVVEVSYSFVRARGGNGR